MGRLRKEKPEEEIYDDLDSYEMEDDSYEDFSEEDGYEDEDITELEDEDFFTDQYEETIKPSRSSGKKLNPGKQEKVSWKRRIWSSCSIQWNRNAKKEISFRERKR